MDKYKIATVCVSGVTAVAIDLKLIPRGITGAVVEFLYDDDIWAGLRKKVAFRGSGEVEVLCDGDTATFPAEVTQQKNRLVTVGITGVSEDGTIVIPTLWAELGTVADSAYGDYPAAGEPVQPVWAQLLAMMGTLANLNTEARENLVAAINEVLSKVGTGGGNVDLSGYVKSVNGNRPDKNGNVEIQGEGLSDEEKALILSLFRNAAYISADVGNTLAQLENLWGGGNEPDIPDVPGHTHSYTSSVTKAATCETEGVRTFSCSCGHSYTEAILETGHNYVDGACTACGAADPNHNTGGEGETEQTEPVYILAEATTFNADKVVDTGYKLLDAEKSWSVCADFTDSARGGYVWDASPNASKGLALADRGNYYRTLHLAGSLYKDIGTAVGNYKVVVTHARNADSVDCYFVPPAATELQAGEITYTRYLTDTNIVYPGKGLTVKIGGNFDGSNTNYKGTVHRFAIYERVLTMDEIKTFTGVSA